MVSLAATPLSLTNKGLTMPRPQQQYAVLTGDIVGSSKLPPQGIKDVMQQLRDAAVRFAETFPGSVHGKLDVFSGDGWQLLMPDWRRSLRAALFLRTIVKSRPQPKIDTRVAVAWGALDAETLNLERVSQSTGEVFTESGRALENMRRHCRLAWVPAPGTTHPPLLKSAIVLVDELARRWTPRQAQALARALLGYSQEQTAEGLGVTQPTVNQSLTTAGWRGVRCFLDEIEIG